MYLTDGKLICVTKLIDKDCYSSSSEASEDGVKHISKFYLKIVELHLFPEHYIVMTSCITTGPSHRYD